jgi:hypothetical protein
MSGLLRRIKRSRAADAGEAPGEGQAAAPEDARKTTEHSAGSTRAEHPATGRATPVDRSFGEPGGPAASRAPGQPAPPAILADPDVPAGVDPAEAAAQPSKGRRGRLRRRLRYLRRARELMLRDLGGLLYEVHRTGGGDLSAHGIVIGAKVQRLASLDAEATAIETALASPRGETVVFQPGIGGTCDACGELYGSGARYCSNCGAPTGAAAVAMPAAGDERARPVPAMPKAPSDAPSAADAPTRLEAAADAPTRAETTGSAAREEAAESPSPGEASADSPGPADAADGSSTETPAEAAGPATNASTERPAEGTAGPITNASTERPADASAADPPRDASAPVDAPTDSDARVRVDAPTNSDAGAPLDAPTDSDTADAADAGPPGQPRRRNPFTPLRNGRARDNSAQELAPGDELARESRS